LEREQRARHIVAAARAVFLERGYAGATMDDVAKAAEFSKPTLYQYFENKDALFFSLTTPMVDELGRRLDDAVARANQGELRSGSQLVGALFEAMQHTYDFDPAAFRLFHLHQQADLLGQMSPGVQADLSRKGRRNFERGRTLLAFGVKKGLLHRHDPKVLLDVAWGTFIGVVGLEGVKQRSRPGRDHLLRTLALAQTLFTTAVAAD
jgi:AcrR family transcriptional regulator